MDEPRVVFRRVLEAGQVKKERLAQPETLGGNRSRDPARRRKKSLVVHPVVNHRHPPVRQTEKPADVPGGAVADGDDFMLSAPPPSRHYAPLDNPLPIILPRLTK